ncbi:MAG: hypothetical protein PVI81_08030 [Anaerolineales bacterium]|jgi:uncharacterized membrane protein
MNVFMIVMRIIHIFSGIFWVGVSFFNIGFLQPTVQATGGEGQSVMQYLTSRTRFTITVYTAATLTLLSGWIMYWSLFKFRLAALASGYGLMLTIGGIAGTIAWVIALVFIRAVLSDMGAIGQAIKTQGGPPNDEQAAQLQALSARMVSLGQWGVVLMVIAVLGMSTAQYVRL